MLTGSCRGRGATDGASPHPPVAVRWLLMGLVIDGSVLWLAATNCYVVAAAPGEGLAHLLGDPVAADGPTLLNPPLGDIKDPSARIWPFKIHEAHQPYDTGHGYLLQPVTSGRGGFWSEFDWDQALRLGSDVTGLPYSGEYGFAETYMYWPQTHMVAPKTQALQCQACHCEGGCLDWEALGYPGDPIRWVRESCSCTTT